MKKVLLEAEAIAILAAVAAIVHFIASVDWPWAIVIGAATAVVARRLIHRRTPAQP